MSAKSTPEATTATRIRGLDGLRGLAALMIFLYHAWGHSGFPEITVVIGSHSSIDLTLYAQFIGQGVAIFFVLSGFLLSLPFWRELQGGPPLRLSIFFKKRFLRIYPAYLIVVLVLGLVYDVAHPLISRVIMVVSHLLLLHNLTEATIYNISAPLWSVATEFQLYIALPLIFLALKKQRRGNVAPLRSVAGLFVVSGAIGVLYFYVANTLLAHIPVDPRLVVAQGRVLLHSPILGAANFCAGIGAGYFYVVRSQAEKSRRGSSLFTEIAAYAVFLMLPFLTQVTLRHSQNLSPSGWPVVPLLFAFLTLATSQGTQPWGIGRILDLAPLRLLGTVSYSFYLWHDFVLWTVWNRLPRDLGNLLGGNIAKTACALLITSVVAWISYQLLELRFGQIISRLLDRTNKRILTLRSKEIITQYDQK